MVTEIETHLKMTLNRQYSKPSKCSSLIVQIWHKVTLKCLQNWVTVRLKITFLLSRYFTCVMRMVAGFPTCAATRRASTRNSECATGITTWTAPPPQTGESQLSRPRRIRRREKLYMYLREYGNLMHAQNHFYPCYSANKGKESCKGNTFLHLFAADNYWIMRARYLALIS